MKDIKKLQLLQDRINKKNPVDLAKEFDQLSSEEMIVWIKLLNKDLLADTFALLSADRKLELIQSLPEDKNMDIIQELDEDELVDTLQELPANMVRKIMSQYVDKEKRPIINELLGYPKESVGSIMSVNFLSIKVDSKPSAALEKISKSSLDANRLEQIWVTDESLILIGFVYLADLLRKQDQDIENFLRPITASVKANDDQEVVAKLAYKYDLSEIPVTDSEGRLIGFVPSEWAIDIIYDEYSEDIANISGIQDTGEESYTGKSSFKIAKERTAWLIICLVTATLTGFIIQRYEDILAASVILTAYIPMLMDSGGNAGTQSSTTIIRALYTGELGYKDIFKVIFKEMKIGLFAGLALVLINMLRMFLIDGVSLAVNLTVSITLVLTVVLSKIIGGVLPLVADKLNVDPTVMAGPIITTIVDTFALLIYFEIASMLIGL